MDLKAFSERIDLLSKTVQRRGPEIQRATAVVALQTVVLATPVGNKTLWSSAARRRARPGYVGGRARANWFASLGSARTDTTTARDGSGSGTISNGRVVIDSGRGEDIHLTNNLPYIIPLNDGHSKQAPAAFVELAVHKAIEAVKNSRLLSETDK